MQNNSQARAAQAQSRNGEIRTQDKPDCFVLSKQTLDMLLKGKRKHRSDCIALLNFYHYTALWQGTNQPKADNRFVAKGLGWNKDLVSAVRQILLKLGLIETVRAIDPRTRKVTGHYVRVLYFSPLRRGKNHDLDFPDSGKSGANASCLVGNASGLIKFFKKNKEPAASECVSPLAFLSEEGSELAEAFTSHLLEQFPRRWLPVTKHTDALDAALDRAVMVAEDVDEFATLCRDVARVCADPRYQGRGGEYHYTDELGEEHHFVVPKAQRKHRGRNSIMDLIWANYL